MATNDKGKTRNLDRISAILFFFSALMFAIVGIASLVNEGFSNWTGLSDTALAIMFGGMAVVFWQKSKGKAK